MAADLRGAAEAVAVKTTITLRDLGDGQLGAAFPDEAKQSVEVLRRIDEGELDREDVDVEMVVGYDGETMLRLHENGNGRGGR